MNVVCVYSEVTGLLEALKALLPNMQFHQILSDDDLRVRAPEIIIGDFHLLAPCVHNTSSVRWIQGTSAGVEKIAPMFDPNKPSPYIITRLAGEHFGKIMAEYVLFSIINNERQMEAARVNQKAKVWSRDGRIAAYRFISDLNVGILGMGRMGSVIGEILHNLGGKVLGYGRTMKDVKGQSYLSGYYTESMLPDFLKKCDYIVNVLPSTPATTGLLNGNVLENCKERRAVFINIGRGSIISESDLVSALNNGWLASAILDVFNEEPLPAHSPLWTIPQVTITPHVAGMNRARDVAQQFRDNLFFYENNQPIPNTVDFAKGY